MTDLETQLEQVLDTFNVRQHLPGEGIYKDLKASLKALIAQREAELLAKLTIEIMDLVTQAQAEVAQKVVEMMEQEVSKRSKRTLRDMDVAGKKYEEVDQHALGYGQALDDLRKDINDLRQRLAQAAILKEFGHHED